MIDFLTLIGKFLTAAARPYDTWIQGFFKDGWTLKTLAVNNSISLGTTNRE